MGLLADAALAAGGEVTGIIPSRLRDAEVAHNGVTELVVVDNMHERKRLMAEKADAFAILPGGSERSTRCSRPSAGSSSGFKTSDPAR